MLIHIYVFISPLKLRQTQNVNSTQEQEILRKGGEMVKWKPFRPPEGNELKIPTDGNKGKAFNPKNYRGKKPQNKPSPKPESKTDFQSRCSDL